MEKMFFENFHNASKDFPHFDNNMRNINYLPHFHQEIEIIFVKSGKVNIGCENRSFIADTGDICIFMPGEIHSFSSSCENHLYITKISCSNSVEKIDFSSLRLKENPINSATILSKTLWEKIELLNAESNEKTIGYAYAVNGISNSIIADILRENITKTIDYSENKKHIYSLKILENVNLYIQNHYAEPITLSDIAKHTNLSKYYFSHFFKEITGSTFYDYLTLFRIEKSLPLLCYSGKKMSEISSDCGFTNTRSFNRAFKSAMNKTPSEYKASIQNK